MATSSYIGFSTVDAISTRQIVKTGINIIKDDLLNHFYTVPGENRMRPTFGCKLRQKLFEQYGSTDRAEIITEVQSVINADPRVTYVSTTITDITYGIVIAVSLTDVDTGTPFTLLATFNQDTDALYGFSGS